MGRSAILVPIQSCGTPHAKLSGGVELAVAQSSGEIDSGDSEAIGLFAVHFDLDVAGWTDFSCQKHSDTRFLTYRPFSRDFSCGDGSFCSVAALRFGLGFAVTDWTNVEAVIGT